MAAARTPMLARTAAEESSERDDERRRLAYTLDHTEYALDASAFTSCDAGQQWLSAFVASGIALGMLFELLQLHAGPAKFQSFFLPFLGYVGQGAVGLGWLAARRSWRIGAWTRRMVGFMVLSSLGDGAAQALDYVALTQAGITLFTILHSSVTLFACLIAFCVLRTPINLVQWVSVIAVVGGLVLTAIPSPIDAHGNFVVGLVCAFAGALCLAASYPLAEMVFRSGRTHAPSAEACALAGSLVNIAAFLIWQLAYTLPRWDALVLRPIAHSPHPLPAAPVALLYAAYSLMVGVHSLAFWKTIGSLGTVPAALSKGAQQGGIFLLAHLLFCHVDPTECITNAKKGDVWGAMQKPTSFVLCALGCLVYAVVKRRRVDKVASPDASAPPTPQPLRAPSDP